MERDGVSLPSVLTTQPRLPVSLLMYLDAFFELDSERTYAQGVVGRIPWSSIVQYAQHYGFEVEETLFFIREMDDAYISQLMSRQGGASGGPTGTREMVQRPPRPN